MGKADGPAHHRFHRPPAGCVPPSLDEIIAVRLADLFCFVKRSFQLCCDVRPYDKQIPNRSRALIVLFNDAHYCRIICVGSSL